MSIKVPMLAAGTTLCALAVGWAMQTFVPEPGSRRPHPDEVLSQTADQADVVSRNDTEFPDATDLPAAPGDPASPAPGCGLRASAHAAPHAFVGISVDAPCSPGGVVTIHHSGLMFTTTADDAGHVDVSVPAMRAQAVFIVALPDGEGTVVSADVQGVNDWHRVALQWQGDAAFHIQAREFGADYGTAGHVWAGNPGNPATGSTLTRLGDGKGPAPRIVEIYSFPAGSGLSGLVDISVEAEVTADTCGRPLTAEALERDATGWMSSRDLDLDMPNCAAIGDFLVLNNFMDDLKIASN
ncbi:MAG: hypothetical protein CML66_23610 [Rhodobacteraceae bacterium]|nr:hypothetical protein [Paracoccaceae bacterium]MAY45844.1 hypothetical protein [Paracoccaceae bacterium]